jgi:tRNA-dihydrouridine synthase
MHGPTLYWTARILEQSGVRRVAVHGRTKAQGYSGYADWSVIGEVAAAVGVPVIGNGDIASAKDALKRRSETGLRA